MKRLRILTHAGLHSEDRYQKKRGILLSNYISLILSSAILILFIFRQSVYGAIPHGLNAWILLMGLVVFLVPILLNLKSKTTLSRVFLSVGPVVFLWFAYIILMRQMPAVETSMYDSLRIFLLAFSVIPYLVLEQGKTATFVFCILPVLLSVLFLDYFMDLAGLRNGALDEPLSDYHLMQIRTFMAYLVINGGYFIFQTVISNNDQFNQRILSELKIKSEKIEAQNEELLQSQEVLNKLNLHLEKLVDDKTADIKLQHEKLKGYAYANAHHVRGPVARQLGLIELSKMESGVTSSWIIEKLETETKDIDRIIRRIALELDESERMDAAPVWDPISKTARHNPLSPGCAS